MCDKVCQWNVEGQCYSPEICVADVTPAPLRIIIECGPPETCPDGSPHDDKLWITEGNMGTVACSKCGSRAIDRDMWK